MKRNRWHDTRKIPRKGTLQCHVFFGNMVIHVIDYFLNKRAVFSVGTCIGDLINLIHGNVANICVTAEEAQQVTRASYDDCMKQIIADCDTAANRLPEQYKGSSESVGFDDKKELGRPTTGSAYGLK